MRKEILQYYAERNATYLHAFGEQGTEALLQELNIKAGDTVLEIGFGTGGTLVKIKARNPEVNLYGLDRSELMLKKAIARLKFCNVLKNVSLKKINPGNVFPFEDNKFNVVYAESVLAIQEGEDLQTVLSEIYRVLKPGGRLVMNESVWCPEISHEEITGINAVCKKQFGIIQANGEYTSKQEWLKLLQSKGFIKGQAKQVKSHYEKVPASKAEYLSTAYTLMGKIKALGPLMIKEALAYKKSMRRVFPTRQQYLEGVIFIAFK